MLQIIPVIDIRGGRVVHARGGNRQQYPALKSLLTNSVTPAEVISDLLKCLPFQQLYIVDLDAIEQGSHRMYFYKALCRAFPQIEFWIDSGIRQLTALSTSSQVNNLRMVAGSETLVDSSMLTQGGGDACLILSLDRKNQSNLGKAELFTETRLWPKSVILMNLDRVGSKLGPDLEWLQTQRSKAPEVAWYLAGGIRNDADLIKAQQYGAAGVLVASALHNGAISLQTMKRLMQ